MQRKQVLWIIIIIAAVIVFFFFFNGISTGSHSQDVNVENINSIVSDAGSNQDPTLISPTDLSTHTTEGNCWISYKGTVYDITDWLQIHPGGVNAILPYCGTSSEFEQAFTRKHGTTKVYLLMQVGKFMGYFDEKGSLSK